MQIGQLLNVNFEKVYLLQNTLNLSASEMLPTFVYKTGMESHNYGYATAAGLFNSVCSVILVVIAKHIQPQGFRYVAILAKGGDAYDSSHSYR